MFYVDFGNTEWLSESHIRKLLPQFAHLPFQAVECFLDEVEPTGGDTEGWSKDAMNVFEDFVNGKVLSAYIKSW